MQQVASLTSNLSFCSSTDRCLGKHKGKQHLRCTTPVSLAGVKAKNFALGFSSQRSRERLVDLSILTQSKNTALHTRSSLNTSDRQNIWACIWMWHFLGGGGLGGTRVIGVEDTCTRFSYFSCIYRMETKSTQTLGRPNSNPEPKISRRVKILCVRVRNSGGTVGAVHFLNWCSVSSQLPESDLNTNDTPGDRNLSKIWPGDLDRTPWAPYFELPLPRHLKQWASWGGSLRILSQLLQTYVDVGVRLISQLPCTLNYIGNMKRSESCQALNT